MSSQPNQTKPQRRDDILTAAAILRMPAGPDKAEVMAFSIFLRHHKPITACDCGVGLIRDGARYFAQVNPDCDCPCHVDGWATGERRG